MNVHKHNIMLCLPTYIVQNVDVDLFFSNYLGTYLESLIANPLFSYIDMLMLSFIIFRMIQMVKF